MSLKLYRKGIRRIAQQALMDEQQKYLRTGMTQGEYKAREEALRASRFADAVISRATTLLANGNDEIITEAPDEGDEEDINIEAPEEDIEVAGDIEGNPELVDNIALSVEDKDNDDREDDEGCQAH